MKWAVAASVLVVVAFLVGNGLGWEMGRRSGGEERVVVVTATPAATEIPATAAVRIVTVVVTATQAPTEISAVTPAPAAAAEEPTAAPARERCDGDQECLVRQCPAVLGGPEVALTGEIEDCVYWLNDLPSGDSGRNVDRERIKTELCKRSPAGAVARYELGYTGEAEDCQ
jgi:hypothetical protein